MKMRRSFGTLKDIWPPFNSNSRLMLSKDKHDKLIEIFCAVDDFIILLDQYLVNSEKMDVKLPRFEGRMSKSEILTIIIFYHFSGHKCFQYYFEDVVTTELKTYFPVQVKYKRFLQLISKSWPFLHLFNQWKCSVAQRTGIYFIDSKKLPK